MTVEQWLPVLNYEGLYEISNLGRIRSSYRGSRILRQCESHRDGRRACNHYLIVSLSKNGKHVTRYVHKLVAEAFLGSCPPGKQIRHGPGGQHDNRVVNLGYGTKEENEQDKIRDGTAPRGSRNPYARVNESMVKEIRNKHAGGDRTYRSLGLEYGIDETTVSLIVRRKTWEHV